MKNIKTYKLFLESYEEIMKNLVSDSDIKSIENTQKQIEDIKNKIDNKKKELEDRVSNLQKLQLDTYTDDNKKLVYTKIDSIKDSIEKLKKDVVDYETSIKELKDKIVELKK